MLVETIDVLDKLGMYERMCLLLQIDELQHMKVALLVGKNAIEKLNKALKTKM